MQFFPSVISIKQILATTHMRGNVMLAVSGHAKYITRREKGSYPVNIYTA